MARPPKNPDSRLSSEIRVRVTADQKRALQDAADAESKDLSAWARDALVMLAKEQVRLTKIQARAIRE